MKKSIRGKTSFGFFYLLLLVICSLVFACSDPFTGEGIPGTVTISVGGRSHVSRSTTGYPPSDNPGNPGPSSGPSLADLFYKVFFNGTEIAGTKTTDTSIRFTVSPGTYNIRVESYEAINGSPSLYATGTASNVQVQAGQTTSVPISMSQALTVTFNFNNGSETPFTTIQAGQGDTIIRPSSDPALDGYTFGDWYKEAACTNQWNFVTDRLTSDILLYAKWNSSYNLGDTGAGGGIIFYFDPAGFTMTDTGLIAHYLEATPAGWDGSGSDPKHAWASYPSSSYNDVPGTGTTIGTGRKNTALMLASGDVSAADASNSYISNGKADWFLPGIDELQELYIAMTMNYVGGFSTTGSGPSDYNYLSSSQSSSLTDAAEVVFFNDGTVGTWVKDYSGYVRAIRAF
jgi:uncharacterized repeat protein (TIGR02543 family)